ncbi:MAG: type II secretion system protein, partial [Armatimonadetes bacterium]|nr:type II secretion system protein [Armatimonadota bacterium]
MAKKNAAPSRLLRRETGRGFSLPSVLILMAIALTAGLAIAASGTVTLNLSNRYAQSQKALRLAEAAVNQAIYRLEGDAAWGNSASGELQVDFGPTNDSEYARITFDRGTGSPYSLNNFGNSSADSSGWGGRVIPPNTVCLVAVAHLCPGGIRLYPLKHPPHCAGR